MEEIMPAELKEDYGKNPHIEDDEILMQTVIGGISNQRKKQTVESLLIDE